MKQGTDPAATATHAPATAAGALFAAWQAHVERREQQPAEWYLQKAHEAIDLGAAYLAFEIAERGRAGFPAHTGLAFVAALALSRGGSLDLAARRIAALLEHLPASDALFSEAWALSGGIAKRRYMSSRAADRDALARASAEAYERALARGTDYFPAINAATMRMLTGDLQRAWEFARLAIKLCDKGTDKDAYWRLATLGEAHALLGDFIMAEAHLRGAVATAGDRYGQIATTRNQLRLIQGHMAVPDSLLAVLRIPAVVAFSGHMPDRPGAATPRFPPALEAEVARAIAGHLKTVDAGFGYTSAAAGGDLLFIEAMQARGAEVHIVLPFATEDFVRTSVARDDEAWLPRFRAALASATSVSHATAEPYLGDELLFDFTNRMIQGAAILRAQQLCVAPAMLTVGHDLEDGGAAVGGTASALECWQRLGHPWTNFDPVFLGRRARGARP